MQPDIGQQITFLKTCDYDIYHCFLRDPNDYLVEIQRFLHPFQERLPR